MQLKILIQLKDKKSYGLGKTFNSMIFFFINGIHKTKSDAKIYFFFTILMNAFFENKVLNGYLFLFNT